MEEQPKFKPIGSKLAYIPGLDTVSRIDPWWGLVLLVIGLVVILITVMPDPFWDILYFVRLGIVITITLTTASLSLH